MVGWWCITCPGFTAITWERLTCGLISVIIQKKSTRAIADAASHVVSSNHLQLPVDTIAEILSRLPAHQIMELRYVCRHWLALTSTQSFRELHFKNQSPMDHLFVIQYHPYATNQTSPLATNYFELFAFSENHRLERGTITIALCQVMRSQYPKKFYKPFLISSYKGFLLFRHDSTAELVSIFYNPTTGEQVNVNAPASRYVYCGFYFHLSSKEYRVLYGVLDDHEQDVVVCIGFAILGLRTRSLRRIGNFSHCPSSLTPPIILNDALHWMVSESTRATHGTHGHTSCSETILSFGTESEEFHVMPHPGDECAGGEGHDSHDTKMGLKEMDGQLCLFVSCDSSTPDHSKKLDIWVLEDYKEWIWAKRHVVMLGTLAIWQVPSPNDNEHQPTVEALSIYYGELLLVSKLYNHIYFFYNLKNGSLSRLAKTTNLAYGNLVVVDSSLVSLHTKKKFGYVLSLHDDDRVAEWDLNCTTYRERHCRIGKLLQMLFRREKNHNLFN